MKKLIVMAMLAPFCAVFADEKAAQPAEKTAGEKLAEQEAEKEEESDDAGVWVEAGVDILSDYMWRGIMLDDNVVWQPTASLGYNTEEFGGLYVNWWASFDLTDRRNRMPWGNNSRQCGSIHEIDYYVGYTKSFGDFDFEVGHYWYDYPYNGKHGNHCAGHLNEDLYFSASYNNAYITPGVEVLWDYGREHGHDPSGCYIRFSAKHKFELTDQLSLTPKATLGLGDHQFTKANIAGYRENSRDNYGAELTDQTTTLTLAYAITENLTISGSINYTWVPSHSLRQERWLTAGHDSRNQLVWGGVNVTLSF